MTPELKYGYIFLILNWIEYRMGDMGEKNVEFAIDGRLYDLIVVKVVNGMVGDFLKTYSL